jgi:hypothetical protein
MPASPGGHDRTGGGDGTELGEDVRHVVPHGLEAEHVVASDLRIRLTAGDVLRDLQFARRELWERVARPGLRRVEGGQDSVGDAAVVDGVACGDGGQRSRDLGRC